MRKKSKETGSYHGPFSTYAEDHAFMIGLFHGFIDFIDWNGLDKSAKKHPAVRKERHYAEGAYICGAILRVALLLIIIKYVPGGL